MDSDDWMADGDVPPDSTSYEGAAPADWLEESEANGSQGKPGRIRRSRGPWDWLPARRIRNISHELHTQRSTRRHHTVSEGGEVHSRYGAGIRAHEMGSARVVRTFQTARNTASTPVGIRGTRDAGTSATSNGFRPGHNPAALGFGNALFGFVLVGVLALTMVLASAPVKASGGEVWAIVSMSMIVQLASCTIVMWLEYHDLTAGRRFPVAYPWAGMVIVISTWLLTAGIVEQL